MLQCFRLVEAPVIDQRTGKSLVLEVDQMKKSLVVEKALVLELYH